MLLVALALCGCSHQVLTFFFTGVPEPGREEAVAAATEDSVTPRRKGRVRKSSSYAHGPYGAGSCDLCHQGRGGGVSPALVQAREDLCVACHSGHQGAAARAAGLWQHGPVANRLCTACHSPHKSVRQFLLLEASNVQLCGQCHGSSDLRHTPQHVADPAAECTDCHNPHAGQNPLMLRDEYDERSRFDRT